MSRPCIRTDVWVSRPGVLMLVCDGGPPAGEVAAQLTASSIKHRLEAEGDNVGRAPVYSLRRAFQGANRALLAEVFARNLFEQGTMSSRDWEAYRGLYKTMASLLPAPDLVIYIRASVATLKSRIAMRGRGFEASIPDEYLAGLNRLYESWIEGFELAPVLVVPGDRLNFVADGEDLAAIEESVVERLRDRQGSLFPFGM